MKREPGYYWVKQGEHSDWEIGEYDPKIEESNQWTLTSDRHFCWGDNAFFKINENRIPSPDAPQESITDDLILDYGWQRNLSGDNPPPRSFKIEFKFMYSDHEPIETEIIGRINLYYSRDGYMKISKEMINYDTMFSGGCTNKKEFLMLMEMLEIKKFFG